MSLYFYAAQRELERERGRCPWCGLDALHARYAVGAVLDGDGEPSTTGEALTVCTGCSEVSMRCGFLGRLIQAATMLPLVVMTLFYLGGSLYFAGWMVVESWRGTVAPPLLWALMLVLLALSVVSVRTPGRRFLDGLRPGWVRVEVPLRLDDLRAGAPAQQPPSRDG